jgi:inner membrane protein
MTKKLLLKLLSVLFLTALLIGLIVFYLPGILGCPSALASGSGFVGRYGALYGLLQSEDNAFLMGSLLLFVVLAAVMISTRRFNWHTLSYAGHHGEPS